MSRLKEELEKSISSLVATLFEKRAFARIYLYLLRHPKSEADSIISGTKLHPSTVRDALVKMNSAGDVTRKKGETETVGKKPYVYSAVNLKEIAVARMRDIERKVNAIFRHADAETTEKEQ